MNSLQFLSDLRSWVSVGATKDTVVVKGLWNIDCIYQPSPVERRFVYQIVVAQTLSQGACYYSGNPVAKADLLALVGQPYNYSPIAHQALDIALLDSVAHTIDQHPYLEIWLGGSSSKKALERARIIVSEVNALATAPVATRKTKVCNVGVVTLVIQELLRQGYDVCATDMDADIIHHRLFDTVLVEPATETLRCVADSDIAVVTGMALATDSLSEILTVAHQSNTRIIVFAETGSGFAPFLVRSGVDSVISEPFPFYIYDGTTSIRIFRASLP